MVSNLKAFCLWPGQTEVPSAEADPKTLSR